MATSCKIGIANANGTVNSIICWHDGYPDWVGEILSEYYDSVERIDDLLRGGNLRDIDKTVCNCIYDSKNRETDWMQCRPETHRSADEYFRTAGNHSYAYLFQDGEWKTYKPGE